MATKLWYIPLEMGAWQDDVDCLTLEAEGALLRIIFKLWKAPEKGRLIFAFDSLSRIIKKPLSEARKIVQELQDNNILNIEYVDGDRVKIESRRMLKEAAISAARSESGKQGGRPKKQTVSKKKAKVKQTPDYNYPSDSDYNSNSSSKNGDPKFSSEVTEIITYLNELADTDFKVCDSHASHINARLKEGYTVADLKEIIEYKTMEWKQDPKMYKFLRPSTLFRESKAAIYRDEVVKAKRTGKRPIVNGKPDLRAGVLELLKQRKINPS